jgi:NAD(P)-dependent dehydrogenase (short-subunit alcohol dehydrogenase family)
MSSYDMDGRVVLITGATDGLGRALAREVAAAGATVLVHGRSEERIADTLDEVPGARGYRADLASLESVHDLATAIGDAEPRLDVLVSNAGIGATVPGGGKRQESADGYELRFAVNYLAGYVLTEALLDLLRACAPSRIVNVASAGQMPIDFDDVMLERDYRGVRAYCQSKLAQIISTFDLAERLDGTGVTVNALHPATYMPTKIVASPTSSLAEGVHATMRLVADPALDGVTGRYYDREREARPDAQAFDPNARRWLRELSERLSGPDR